MKKTIIIGGRNFGQTELLRREIEKVLEKQGSVVIATTQDVKNQMQNNKILISGKEYFEFSYKPIDEPIFDNPKSKYHK